MSTLKSIIFETLPDPEEYYETAEALRDLDSQYQHFTRTVWKASKQLMKFDEINRLVASEGHHRKKFLRPVFVQLQVFHYDQAFRQVHHLETH